MKILIIGGTGFIGRHVVRMLCERGYEVAIFHRGKTKAERPDHIRHIYGDRERLSDYMTQINETNPDIVIDLYSLFESHAKQVVDVFKDLAERIIIASSLDVYRAYEIFNKLKEGNYQAVLINEESDLRTIFYPYRGKLDTDFAFNYEKILVEKVILHQDDIPGTILRFPMVYGPNDSKRRFSEYVKRMNDGRAFILLDERIAGWKGIKGYVENVAAAVITSVENQQEGHQIFNVGEAAHLTELEWIKEIAKVMNWQGEIITVPKELMPSPLPFDTEQHLVVDTSKIREVLHYKEPIAFDQGMERTVRWELENLHNNTMLKNIDYEAEEKIYRSYKSAGNKGQ